MATTKPLTKVRWADTTAVNITDPLAALKDVGYLTNAIPTAHNFNWIFNQVQLWQDYLQGLEDAVMSWTQAHTFNVLVTIIGVAGATVTTNGGNGLTVTGGIAGATSATGGYGAQITGGRSFGAHPGGQGLKVFGGRGGVGGGGGTGIEITPGQDETASTVGGGTGIKIFPASGGGSGGGSSGMTIQTGNGNAANQDAGSGIGITGGNATGTGIGGGTVTVTQGTTATGTNPAAGRFTGGAATSTGAGGGGVQGTGGASVGGAAGVGGTFTGGVSAAASTVSADGVFGTGGAAGSSTGGGGNGLHGVGGSGASNSTNGGSGVYGLGGTASSTGKTGGAGGYFTGGAISTGTGAISGHGVVVQAGASAVANDYGHGVYVKNPASIDATNLAYGMYLEPGMEIKFAGTRTAYTQSDTSLRNVMTAHHMVQHSGHCTTDAAGGVTVNSGIGGWTASVQGTDTIRITFGGTFLGVPVSVLATDGYYPRLTSLGSSYFEFKLTRDGTTFYNVAGLSIGFCFASVGRY